VKLNAEELVIGAIVGLTFAIKVGWLAIPLACLTSFLWALTGSESKWNSKLWRRLVVPVVCAGLVALVYKSWVPMISVPLASAVLHLGYGIPDKTDEGSWLGRLCLVYMGGDEKKANLLCRAIIYTLLALAFIPCLLT
jgi:hypothetical protein